MSTAAASNAPLRCECTGDPDGCAEAAAYRVRWLCLDPACPDQGTARSELLCGPCMVAARERGYDDWDGAARL